MSRSIAADRTHDFKNREHDRYWWFRATSANYTPPIFSFLTDDEWSHMAAWYEETDREFPHGAGECNVPSMTFLMGLIMGNNMSRIVQCGHYIGFSTLILGFMLRHMGHNHGLFSVDFNSQVTEYTARWVERTGLGEYVHLEVRDSADPPLPAQAIAYLGGQPHLVFIDSSHEYAHTLRELDLWFHEIQPGGFALMHDVSEFAISFDGTKDAGVKGAVQHWSKSNNVQAIMINDFAGPSHFGDRTVYKDACGLGLLQRTS